MPRVPRVPRRVVRAAAAGYLGGLELVLRQPFVAVEYRARLTGRIRQVVLEIVEREPGRIVVVSGHGPKASWYRDVLATPAVRVTAAGLPGVAATAGPLSARQVAAVLGRCRAANPDTLVALARAFDAPALTGTPPDPAVADRMPMLELTPRAGS